jgi:hypothetical protein
MKYTVTEIDAMRAAIFKRLTADIDLDKVNVGRLVDQSEDQLRTYMANGTQAYEFDPDGQFYRQFVTRSD